MVKQNFIKREKCELCNSNSKKILYSEKFLNPNIWNFLNAYYNGLEKNELKDGNFEIAKCNNCSFIWQTDILNNELVGKLYNLWISSEKSLSKKKNSGISIFSNYARDAELISVLLKKKPNEIKVLDWGMGWGHWCLMQKAFGYNVFGFELSEERIAYAKENSIMVIQEISELEDLQFDFINAEQVFEHVPKPLDDLKSLVKILNYGGIIKISVPNGKNVVSKLKNNGWDTTMNSIHPLEHINCFTHKTLISIANLAGLKLMTQPSKISFRRGIKSFIRGSGANYYNQYFGTSLYFKKT